MKTKTSHVTLPRLFGVICLSKANTCCVVEYLYIPGTEFEMGIFTCSKVRMKTLLDYSAILVCVQTVKRFRFNNFITRGKLLTYHNSDLLFYRQLKTYDHLKRQ